jgi:KaiC/GvpD/RAD55 family RecA-like ATPase
MAANPYEPRKRTAPVLSDAGPANDGAPAKANAAEAHPVTLAQAFEAHRKRGPLVRLPTGLEGIDRATCGGIPLGGTVFFVGAPDAAKTLLLLVIAIAWARRGILVGFMAVDEELDDLVTRIAQQTVTCESPDGEAIHFSRQDYERGSAEVITDIEKRIGELPILFFDASWSLERATEYLAAEAKRQDKRSAFFADSLQTVRSSSTPEDASERRTVADNAKALRQAAVRHGMATLATSESNREYSKAKRKGEAAVAMSAGAESRAVEFTARALFVLSAVEDSNLIEVEVPKNKLGPRKAFHLAIDRATQTLSDAPSPELVPKASRSEANAERRRVQAAKTAERKERERAESEQRKKVEAAEREAAEDRKLVALLREDRVWLKTELRAALGGKKDHAIDAIVRARKYIDDSEKGPNNSTRIKLIESALPESLR